MTTALRRLSAVLLAAAHAAPAAAQDARAGSVLKVSGPDGREVAYPTRLAEVLSTSSVARAVAPDAPIAAGEAVLTKAALTHVKMAPGQPEAVLYADTLVRFDGVNQWLLRNGAAFVVNRRGKLALVVEGLETLLVGSEVYVERKDSGLFAYVLEGSVRMGTAAGAVVLGPDQCGWTPAGGAARRTEPGDAERARVRREIARARDAMRPPSVVDRGHDAGGHGGAVAGAVLGLGAVGAGVYFLTKDDALPDLVPVPAAGGAACGSDERQRAVVRVRNGGEGGAPGSQTRLASPRGGTVLLPTPALAAGETAVLAVPNAALCLCPVELEADADGRVEEADERNNALQQACGAIGSAR